VFDIGFTELLLIATISLIVIGPERLPETVRTVSLWIGRFKRSLRETRREIEQQIGADEIRRELHNEEIMRNLERLRQNVNTDLDNGLAGEDAASPSIRPPESGPDSQQDAQRGSPQGSQKGEAAEHPSTGNEEAAGDTASDESPRPRQD